MLISHNTRNGLLPSITLFLRSFHCSFQLQQLLKDASARLAIFHLRNSVAKGAKTPWFDGKLHISYYDYMWRWSCLLGKTDIHYFYVGSSVQVNFFKVYFWRKLIDCQEEGWGGGALFAMECSPFDGPSNSIADGGRKERCCQADSTPWGLRRGLSHLFLPLDLFLSCGVRDPPNPIWACLLLFLLCQFPARGGSAKA